jgi:predicted RNA-binding Zn ribbon-like protein
LYGLAITLVNRIRGTYVTIVAARTNSRSGELIAGPGLVLCLEFANTLAGRGGDVPLETLHAFDDLIGWCQAAGFLPEADAAQCRSRAREKPDRAESIFASAISLREAIYRIFARLALGAEAENGDLNDLNRALAEAPMRNTVARGCSGFGWRIDPDREAAAALLAPVVWSAGDLLAGKHLGRVRLCANQKCLWLFLDDSLGGARRWCSMQACGNRAKTRRHYLRSKGE